MCVGTGGGLGVCGNSLCLPLSFALSLTLLGSIKSVTNIYTQRTRSLLLSENAVLEPGHGGKYRSVTRVAVHKPWGSEALRA